MKTTEEAFEAMKADGITEFTLGELAFIGRTSYQVIHNYVMSKRIKAHRNNEGAWRVTYDDAKAWAVPYLRRKNTKVTRDMSKYMK